jgi:hypothetical protein
MWLVTGGGILALAIAIAGARGNVPVAIGIAGGVLFAISILLAGVLGLKMHRQALADREMAARRSMIVMLAATLGKQDDAVLEGIKTQGGPAGEAAALILEGRQTSAGEQAS